MKFTVPLRKAEFLARPNRFLTRVRLGNKIVDSHLPDPGRLIELLTPGAELRIRPESGSRRRTRYTTVMVKTGATWVSLVSTFANVLAREWITAGRIPGLAPARIIRAEIPWENHRFDFMLERNGVPYYLEVKSVTWAENGIAQFPDAVSARATRHILALQHLTAGGTPTGILFVCQRSDVNSFSPMVARDPVFAQALSRAAAAGVEIHCAAATVSEYDIRYYREIPVNLTL